MASVWGFRSWARSAAGIEVMTTEQADAFEAQFDQDATGGVSGSAQRPIARVRGENRPSGNLGTVSSVAPNER
jgi:hypothetical protein